jgi:hypothetical protein
MNEEEKLELVNEAIERTATAAKAYLRARVKPSRNLEALKLEYADASKKEWETIKLLGVDLDEVRKLRGWEPNNPEN